MASASCSGGITGGSYGLRRARWASTSGATRRTSSIVASRRPSSPARAAAARHSVRSARRPSAPDGERQPAGDIEHVVADDGGRRGRERGGQRLVGGGEVRPATVAATVVGEPAAHGLGPLGDVGRGGDVDAQPEAVEQLRAQLALLGVHRADEHEAGRVAVGDAVALDEVLAGDGDVEQDVDEVVGEEVDLVDVQHAAVGRGEQAGPERQLAAGQRGRDVERAEQPVLGRAERQLDEAARADRRGRGPASSSPSPCGRAAGHRRSAGRPRRA